MTTEFTFCNETAARLFAEYWNRTWGGPKATVEDNEATIEASPEYAAEFQQSAEFFNAAAQHAGEIAGGAE